MFSLLKQKQKLFNNKNKIEFFKNFIRIWLFKYKQRTKKKNLEDKIILIMQFCLIK